MILVRRMFGPRPVGASFAVAIAAAAAVVPFGDWWATFDFGGIALRWFPIVPAALLGWWRAPRLVAASHAIALREALVVSMLAVPLVAFLTAGPGVLEIIITGADYPVLAPVGLSVFGLLHLGPVSVLMAIPAALLWAEAVRLDV